MTSRCSPAHTSGEVTPVDVVEHEDGRSDDGARRRPRGRPGPCRAPVVGDAAQEGVRRRAHDRGQGRRDGPPEGVRGVVAGADRQPGGTLHRPRGEPGADEHRLAPPRGGGQERDGRFRAEIEEVVQTRAVDDVQRHGNGVLHVRGVSTSSAGIVTPGLGTPLILRVTVSFSRGDSARKKCRTPLNEFSRITARRCPAQEMSADTRKWFRTVSGRSPSVARPVRHPPPGVMPAHAGGASVAR